MRPLLKLTDPEKIKEIALNSISGHKMTIRKIKYWIKLFWVFLILYTNQFCRIHLIKILFYVFLQARASSALSTREGSVSALKNCWEILKCETISFVTLVTGAFPPPKVCTSYKLPPMTPL